MAKYALYMVAVLLFTVAGCGANRGGSDETAVNDEGPGDMPGEGMGGLPVTSVEDGLSRFADALKVKEPDFIVALTADEILAGEAYSEGTRFTRTEFADILADGENPYTRSLFSEERVNNFINEYNAGTLSINDTGDGGKAVSTAEMDWYLEFRPGTHEFGNQWELAVCAVRMAEATDSGNK